MDKINFVIVERGGCIVNNIDSGYGIIDLSIESGVSG